MGSPTSAPSPARRHRREGAARAAALALAAVLLVSGYVGGGRSGAPGPGPAAAGEFLSVLDDVPLMPGLTEIAESAVAFETAAGRIVEVRAAGTPGPELDAGRVRAFYAATLPALGWKAEGGGRFVRGGERLSVTAKRSGARIVALFALRPR